MNFPFQSQSGLIILGARLEGPAGGTTLRLALDTGASRTVISTIMLVAAGYDVGLSTSRIQMTTGSGVEYVPVITIDELGVLGQERKQWPIIGHTLPPSATIDGLLGLDFFRGKELNIYFRAGLITLN